MWNVIKWSAALSRPARFGLAAAATAATVGAAAAFALTTPAPVETRQTAAQPESDSVDIADLDLEEGATPIEIEVDPKLLDWPDDHTIEISGTTAIDASDPRVTMTVVTPSGWSYKAGPLPAGIDGRFATTLELYNLEPEKFTPPPGAPAARPPIEFGEFTVNAVSPGGFGSASASFAVVRTGEVKTYDWAEPADRLARRAGDLVANLKTCLANMPVSPAREDLKRKLAELDAALAPRGAPFALGSYLAPVVQELGTFPDAVGWMSELIEPLEEQMDGWGAEAKGLEGEVRHDPLRCSGAATCDSTDLVLQDLQRLTELTAFLERPVKLIADYGQSPALKDRLRKRTMVDTQLLDRKLEEARRALDGDAPSTMGSKSLTGWLAKVRHATDVAKLFAGQELFEPYCQKFEGPFSAQMEATFASKQGKVWWRYTIALEGRLTLRYPSRTPGPSVSMTGELTGCATGFKSWDDALRIGWPKLMAGAMVFRTVQEPFAGDSCARFDLPVKAELTEGELILEMEPAARKDYGEPVSHVRYVVVSPLAGGLPAQTSFTLPYKSAHFILMRTLEDKPLKLLVSRQGKQLVVAKELKASRGSGGAHGTYGARIKVCNPSCAR